MLRPESHLVALACLVAACASAPAAPQVDTRRVTVPDGVELVLDVAGESSPDAPTLVLVHGFCCNRGQFADTLARFSRTHRVVAVDLAGHGESGADREVWTVDGLGRDLAQVVRELELEQVVFVGHSMGGPVALVAAAELPDVAVGLVGVDCLHDPDLRFTREGFAPAVEAMEADPAAFWEANLAGALAPGASDALRARLIADARATPLAVAQGLMLSFADVDPAALVLAAGIPVRVIAAELSQEMKAERWSELAPDFEVTTIGGVGHFVMLEDPRAFERALRAALESLD